MSREFKSVLPQAQFINFSKLSDEGVIGVVAEGEFVGTVDNKFGGKDFKLRTEKGEPVIVNQTGSLKRQMENISEGEYIQIRYEGKTLIQSGPMQGKQMHKVLVLKAED